LPDKKEEPVLEGNERIFIKWENLKDAFVQRTILTYVRKWVDGVGHYVDFVARKIQNNGIYLEYTYNIVPLVDGYNVYISLRITGVDAERVANRYRSMRRAIEVARKYRDLIESVEKEAEEVMESGGGGQDSTAEEAEEDA
jgi:hypothetical protein